MRVPLRFTLAIYAILVPLILVLVSAEQMPAIVARFEETRDLWRKLYHDQHVTDTASSAIEGPSAPWSDFLKTYGNGIVTEEIAKLEPNPRKAEAHPVFKKMFKFVKNPSKHTAFFFGPETPRPVASTLITKYAEHLRRYPHLVAVYEHMKLPDNELLRPSPRRSGGDNFFVSD